MNDPRKAAEMALETLCVGANDAVPNDIDKRFEQAIQALRQALAQRELFERTYTFDVDAVNMSEERVHKTDKSIYEPVECMCGICKLGRREWVGLTDGEREFFKGIGFVGVDIIEAKLKEKNA